MQKPMPAPPEVIKAPSKKIYCDGNGGALGHPRIFLNMGKNDFVECPYCDRRFELIPGADQGGGH